MAGSHMACSKSAWWPSRPAAAGSTPYHCQWSWLVWKLSLIKSRTLQINLQGRTDLSKILELKLSVKGSWDEFQCPLQWDPRISRGVTIASSLTTNTRQSCKRWCKIFRWMNFIVECRGFNNYLLKHRFSILNGIQIQVTPLNGKEDIWRLVLTRKIATVDSQGKIMDMLLNAENINLNGLVNLTMSGMVYRNPWDIGMVCYFNFRSSLDGLVPDLCHNLLGIQVADCGLKKHWILYFLHSLGTNDVYFKDDSKSSHELSTKISELSKKTASLLMRGDDFMGFVCNSTLADSEFNEVGNVAMDRDAFGHPWDPDISYQGKTISTIMCYIWYNNIVRLLGLSTYLGTSMLVGEGNIMVLENKGGPREKVSLMF
ncbi:hypothetical protein Leryth_024969 [Lithospermum erythrorhizon]|nr:hypothetical protein Leryth_024969 [Lithospermum erythrorhizon]